VIRAHPRGDEAPSVLIFGPAIRRARPLLGAGMMGGMNYFPFTAGGHSAQAHAAAATASAAAPAVAAGPKLVADLTALKELLESGALTPDEFAAAKAKLLA
jgi:membrane protease subunit (stomatin/prohibitin family)